MHEQLIIFDFERKIKNIRKRDAPEERIIIKRRKADDSTNSDVLVCIKDARNDDQRYWLFKHNSEIIDKRHSIVESIFGEFKVDVDIIFSEEYSSSDESIESPSRGNEIQRQNTVQNCKDTRKCMY